MVVVLPVEIPIDLVYVIPEGDVDEHLGFIGDHCTIVSQHGHRLGDLDGDGLVVAVGQAVDPGAGAVHPPEATSFDVEVVLAEAILLEADELHLQLEVEPVAIAPAPTGIDRAPAPA